MAVKIRTTVVVVCRGDASDLKQVRSLLAKQKKRKRVRAYALAYPLALASDAIPEADEFKFTKRVPKKVRETFEARLQPAESDTPPADDPPAEGGSPADEGEPPPEGDDTEAGAKLESDG